MPVVESGERDISTPNRNTVTANPQKNANTMAAHCAPRVLALFSLSPAFWSTHTACSSATCGPRGPTRRMDQPESAYTSAAHASSGRIPPAAGEEHPPCPVLPQTKSNCPQKMDSKKIKRADSVSFGASAGARDLQAAGTICVCVIYSILCRDGPDGPNGDVSGPDGHGTAASTACTVDGRQRGSSRLQSFHLPLPSIGACRAWGCMFACEIESLRVRYPVRGRAQGR